MLSAHQPKSRNVGLVQVEAQQAVTEAITAVCSSHGAVHMASTTVGACPAEPPRNAAVLLSSDGPRLAIRYDLRTPFASWLASRSASGCVESFPAHC